MDFKQRNFMKARTEKTAKKVMKKTRTGLWVTVAMVGAMIVGTTTVGTVGAEEQSDEEVAITSVVEQESDEDGASLNVNDSDSIIWVANTSEQVASEMERQSTDKQQDPLKDYTITWGDTLSVIAQVTGSSVEELAELNNIENVDLIYAGDEMVLADGSVIRVGEEVVQGAEQESTQEVVETPQDEQGEVSQEQVSTSEQESTQGQVVQTPQDEQNDVEDEQDTGNFGAVDGDVDKKPDPVVDNDTDNDEQDSDEQESDEQESDVDNNNGTDEDEGSNEDNGSDEQGGEEPEDETPVEEEPVEEEPVEEEPVIVEENPVEPEAPVVEEETEPVVEQEGNTGEDVDNREPTETVIVPETDVPVVNETDPEVQEPQDPEEGEEQAPVITTAERTETYDIDYKLITRPNPELPLGEERVVQEGNFGKLTKTYKVTYRDGEEVNVEYVGETVTTAPVDTIIEYGTYVEPQPEISTSTRTVTEQIGYTEVIRENPNMYVGEEVVVQEGSYGEVVAKYKITYQDGEVVATDFISEEITKEPVNTIIDRGTKPVESTKTRTETEVVPFETETRINSDMFEGETRVVQEGVNGVRTTTFEQTFERGELVKEEQVSSTITTQPVNRIVEVGTKERVDITTETETVSTVLNYDTERYASFDLYEGEERVVQQGVNGEKVEVYEVTYENGVEVGRVLVSTEVTSEPINQIIEYGILVREDVVDDINNGLFNQEMLSLVNGLRREVGVEELSYNTDLQAGADLRAEEVHEVFEHTRPDGSLFITAFGFEEPNYYLGENIALVSITEDDRENDRNGVKTLERTLAEKFFNLYYGSEGHYNNMVNQDYEAFTTSSLVVEDGRVSNVQIFDSGYRH